MASITANRTAKAARLAEWIRTHASALDLDATTLATETAKLTDTQWARAAELAGENIPSSATREAIVKILNPTKPQPADPFDGLPKF